jgi:hypothetical protein
MFFFVLETGMIASCISKKLVPFCITLAAQQQMSTVIGVQRLSDGLGFDF